MAEQRDERLYLTDIKDAIDRVLRYTHAGREAFFADPMAQDAVVPASGGLVFKGTVTEPATVTVGGKPASLATDGHFEGQAVVPGVQQGRHPREQGSRWRDHGLCA